jgi:uncharacterized OB-fold protein
VSAGPESVDADESYRPVPVVHDRTAPFWTGGERDELMMQRCGGCGHLVHPPALLCPWDQSPALEWEVLSGHGRVESFSENCQPFLPGFPERYLVALVQVDEDPTARVLTNVVDVDADDVAIGMPVQVKFIHLDGDGGPDVYLPVFAPADDGADRDDA